MDLNCSNITNISDQTPITVKLLVIPIFAISLIGNLSTILIVSLFRQRNVPDVLVLGLAITDLLATLIPLPMTIYSYINDTPFPECSAACNIYATLAQFTRYSSALITTVIAAERYLAICQPFYYKRRCTPLLFSVVIIISWSVAFVIAVVPAIDPGTPVSSHNGFCLFNFTSHYSIAIIVYGALLFIVMLGCFVPVTIAMIKLRCRRKRFREQSSVKSGRGSLKGVSEEANTKPTPPHFKQKKLVTQISDVGRTLRKAASQRFQFATEVQFLWMFTAVVALFYISWIPIVVMIIVAQVHKDESRLEEPIFWGTRLTVISLAINPFLYGLLAGQYRQAYVYVIKLVLSKCCPCCVKHPEQNIHARPLRISPSTSIKRHQITFRPRKSLVNNAAARISAHIRQSIFGKEFTLPESNNQEVISCTNIQHAECASPLPESSEVTHSQLNCITETTPPSSSDV